MRWIIVAALTVLLGCHTDELPDVPPKDLRTDGESLLDEFTNPLNPLSPLNPASPVNPLRDSFGW